MNVQKLYEIDILLSKAKVPAMLRKRISHAVGAVTAALRDNDGVAADRAVAELSTFAAELPEKSRKPFLNMIASAQTRSAAKAQGR